MKLHRPYIPWSVRRQVIERQIIKAELWTALRPHWRDERATRWMIEALFPSQKVELNHDPALCNRVKFVDLTGAVVSYTPDANDPDYLAYMPVADHDIRTRVRGPHGQHSDLGLARKRKRAERKKAAYVGPGEVLTGTDVQRRLRRRLRSRGFDKTRTRRVDGRVVPR